MSRPPVTIFHPARDPFPPRTPQNFNASSIECRTRQSCIMTCSDVVRRRLARRGKRDSKARDSVNVTYVTVRTRLGGNPRLPSQDASVDLGKSPEVAFAPGCPLQMVRKEIFLCRVHSRLVVSIHQFPTLYALSKYILSVPAK